MNQPDIPPRQRIPIFQFSVVFIAIIVILQLWLLSSSLDEYLAGERKLVLPAALASGFCVLLCWWLVRAATKGDR